MIHSIIIAAEIAGLGMLGIFASIIIIMLITMLLNKLDKFYQY